jgi:hypothetical protein
MNIDLRQIIFATLWKKYEKKLITEEIKNEIRAGKATYKFADYGKVKLKDYTQSEYTEEDQKKINEFIKMNHIEKVKKVKTNYSIEFIPSEKAINEFNKMLNDLEESEHKNIAKIAEKVKNIM